MIILSVSDNYFVVLTCSLNLLNCVAFAHHLIKKVIAVKDFIV